jgi:hypothetical protein
MSGSSEAQGHAIMAGAIAVRDVEEHGLEFRRAAELDLWAEYDLFVAAEDELWHRYGLGWTASPFQDWRAPHRHLLAEDGERSFVALDGAGRLQRGPSPRRHVVSRGAVHIASIRAEGSAATCWIARGQATIGVG